LEGDLEIAVLLVRLDDRGETVLKGVPEPARLYVVTSA
jgi:hypothetical protein